MDSTYRIRGWPDETARALQIPPHRALGRPCWQVLGTDQCRKAHASQGEDGRNGESCCGGPQTGGIGAHPAVLPLGDAAQGAIVWCPFTRLTAATAGVAGFEGLVIRGALADRVGSLESILEGIRCACGADDCELFLIEQTGREVVMVDCEGRDRDAFMERTRMPLGVGYAGMITLHQRAYGTNHLESDRRFVRKAVKRSGIHSFVGVPLNDAGRPLGYLGVGWRDDSVPLAWSLRVLEDLKSMVRLAIPQRLLPQPPPAVPAAPLVIRCFGSFEILRHGQVLPVSVFARRKALQLLQILLLRRGAPVHRDELVEL
ncbi:MAG: GAF domain-containing protein, partial [Gammaproteobacteria bacterium]|nr:GAF domain-containing protein [Gammaproteobacteria bacterium]